jgi:membrane protein implicated in regulation of membrane protease activity
VIFLGALLLAVLVLSPPWSYVVVIGAGVVEHAEAWFWWWLSHRREPAVGVETLIGARGAAASPCRPYGQVRVRGELWQGRCDAGADPGDAVVVVAVEGLTLVVERA